MIPPATTGDTDAAEIVYFGTNTDDAMDIVGLFDQDDWDQAEIVLVPEAPGASSAGEQRTPRRPAGGARPAKRVPWTGAASSPRLLTTDLRLQALVASPDGRFLAAGGAAPHVSRPARLIVWDTATLSVAFERVAEAGETTSAVAFSPDARLLALGCSDRTVRILVTDSWREVARFVLPHGVRSLAFTPDGEDLVGAATMPSAASAPGAAAFPLLVFGVGGIGDSSGAGSAAATGSLPDEDDIAEIVAMPRALVGHNGGVQSVAVSPGGSRIASAGLDGTVRVWDGAGSREDALASLLPHPWPSSAARPHPILSVAFSPDGGTLLTGAGGDGAISLIRLRGGNRAGVGPSPGARKNWRRIALPVGMTRARAYWGPGGVVYAATFRGDLALYDPRAGSWTVTDLLQSDPVCLLAFAPGGDALALGGENGDVTVSPLPL